MTAQRTHRSETITTVEADTLRAQITRLGIHRAADLYGVDYRTLTKVLARLPVSRLTATVIRARISRI